MFSLSLPLIYVKYVTLYGWFVGNDISVRRENVLIRELPMMSITMYITNLCNIMKPFYVARSPEKVIVSIIEEK